MTRSFVRAFELGPAPDQLDAVALELVADDVPLVPDDLLRTAVRSAMVMCFFTCVELPNSPRWLAPVRCSAASRRAFEGIVPVLIWAPPRTGFFSMIGDALAELGGLDGRLLPRGAGADHDDVEVFHSRHDTGLLREGGPVRDAPPRSSIGIRLSRHRPWKLLQLRKLCRHYRKVAATQRRSFNAVHDDQAAREARRVE